MVKCPDCEAKDRITIAGKVFCANCGTPYVPSAPVAVLDSSRPIVVAPTPGPSPIPTPVPIASKSPPVSPSVSLTPPVVVPPKPKPVAPILPVSPITPSTPKAAPKAVSKPNPPAQILTISQEVDKAASSTTDNNAADSEIDLGTLQKKEAAPVLSDAQFIDLANMPNQAEEPDETPTLTIDTQPSAPPTTPVQSSPPILVPAVAAAPVVMPVSLPPEPAVEIPLPVAAAIPAPPVRLQDVVMPLRPSTIPAAPVARRRNLVLPVTQNPTAINNPAPTVAALSSAGSMSHDQALHLALDGTGGQAAVANVGTDFRPLKVAAVIVALVLLGGYLWQVNYPNLALKIASARAGLTANLPNYLPGGWSIDHHILSSSSRVSYVIHSPNNSQQIQISQTKTTWDSQALLENYVQAQATDYTTIQAQGLVIYLYGDHATWINHGSWFSLNGTGSGLSQDQLIKIALNL